MRNSFCISLIPTSFCIIYHIPQGMIFIGDKCSFLADMWLELPFDLWFQFIFGGDPVTKLFPNGLPGITSFTLSLPIHYRNLPAENKLW